MEAAKLFAVHFHISLIRKNVVAATANQILEVIALPAKARVKLSNSQTNFMFSGVLFEPCAQQDRA
jgi:hypothetical protein